MATTIVMPPNVKPEFGEAVRRVLREHGHSLRSQRVKTGIGHMTVKDMSDGIIPTLGKLEAFARAFHLDVNEWRQLAGYEPVEDERPAIEQIRENSRTLTYDPDFEGATGAGYRGSELSPDDAEALDRIYRAFLTEQRRKQGRE